MNPTVNFRSLLVNNDPLRNWSYIWNRDGFGTSQPAVDLLPPSGPPVALKVQSIRTTSWWENHHYAISLPESPATPPGSYSLRVNGLSGGPVTVVTPPPLVVWPFNPGNFSTSILEATLASRDVSFAPGVYVFDRSVNLTPGRRIVGSPGTIFVKLFNRNDYRDRMFQVADNVTFVNIAFNGGNYIFSGRGNDDHTGRNMSFANCSFYDCQLGHWSQDGLLVQSSKFVRSSAGMLMCGLFVNCRWEGLCPLNHAFVCEASRGLGIVGGVFDGTDRGIVLRSGWGPNEDFLAVGVDFRNIGQVDNGCELVTVEGVAGATGAVRPTLLHLRGSGNEGPVNFWSAPVRNGLFVDWSLDRSTVMFAAQGCTQTDNELRDWELRGGGLLFAPGASRNSVDNVACIGWQPSRANQFSGQQGISTYKYPPAVIWADGPEASTNTCRNCTVLRQPDGVRPLLGPSVVTH